jgi:hypothetical protein
LPQPELPRAALEDRSSRRGLAKDGGEHPGCSPAFGWQGVGQMQPDSHGSIDPKARTVGVVWLLYFFAAFSSALLAKGLVVAGDGATSAGNIQAHASLYQASLALDLAGNAIYLALSVMLYQLFKPVDSRGALLAACFGLAGCIVQMSGGLLRMVPLVLLGGTPLDGVFPVVQVQALALLALKLHAQVFSISLVLFALFDLLVGYLIVASTFLPGILGWLMIVAGAGWLTFFWPPLATALSAVVLPFGALAEMVVMVWLLVRGVDAECWRARRHGA